MHATIPAGGRAELAPAVARLCLRPSCKAWIRPASAGSIAGSRLRLARVDGLPISVRKNLGVMAPMDGNASSMDRDGEPQPAQC